MRMHITTPGKISTGSSNLIESLLIDSQQAKYILIKIILSNSTKYGLINQEFCLEFLSLFSLHGKSTYLDSKISNPTRSAQNKDTMRKQTNTDILKVSQNSP